MPIIFEMNGILEWWLDKNDSQTVIFSQLMVVYAIILALNNPISFIIQATGCVKEYNIKVEVFTILCMPATYLAFKFGAPAEATFILMIVAVVCSHIVRLKKKKKYYPLFSYKEYTLGFLLPAVMVLSIEFVLLWFLHDIINCPLIIKILIMLLIVIVLAFPIIYHVGLNNYEKTVINSYFKRLKLKC